MSASSSMSRLTGQADAEQSPRSSDRHWARAGLARLQMTRRQSSSSPPPSRSSALRSPPGSSTNLSAANTNINASSGTGDAGATSTLNGNTRGPEMGSEGGVFGRTTLWGNGGAGGGRSRPGSRSNSRVRQGRQSAPGGELQHATHQSRTADHHRNHHHTGHNLDHGHDHDGSDAGHPGPTREIDEFDESLREDLVSWTIRPPQDEGEWGRERRRK